MEKRSFDNFDDGDFISKNFFNSFLLVSFAIGVVTTFNTSKALRDYRRDDVRNEKDILVDGVMETNDIFYKMRNESVDFSRRIKEIVLEEK